MSSACHPMSGDGRHNDTRKVKCHPVSFRPRLSTICHPHYYFISHTIVARSSHLGNVTYDLMTSWENNYITWASEWNIANYPTSAKPKTSAHLSFRKSHTFGEMERLARISCSLNTIASLCWWKQFSNLTICSHETRYLWMLMQGNKTPALF